MSQSVQRVGVVVERLQKVCGVGVLMKFVESLKGFAMRSLSTSAGYL
jgi:lipoate-protein ligase B